MLCIEHMFAMATRNLCKYDWAAVAAFYEAGHTRLECQRRFGFSQAAFTKAIRSGRLDVPLVRSHREGARHACRGNPIYDWRAIQEFYDAGHSFDECRARFGFCAAAWEKAVRADAF